jgi:membrane protein DedA with SNARE-associated domain
MTLAGACILVAVLVAVGGAGMLYLLGRRL